MDTKIFNGAHTRVYVMATPTETKSFVYYRGGDYVCAFKCKGTLEPSEKNVRANAIAGAIDMIKFLQGDLIKETPIVFYVNNEISNAINQTNFRYTTNQNELNFWKKFDEEFDALMKKKKANITFVGLNDPEKIIESYPMVKHMAKRDIKVINKLTTCSPVHWKQVWDLYIV